MVDCSKAARQDRRQVACRKCKMRSSRSGRVRGALERFSRKNSWRVQERCLDRNPVVGASAGPRQAADFSGSFSLARYLSFFPSPPGTRVPRIQDFHRQNDEKRGDIWAGPEPPGKA